MTSTKRGKCSVHGPYTCPVCAAVRKHERLLRKALRAEIAPVDAFDETTTEEELQTSEWAKPGENL